MAMCIPSPCPRCQPSLVIYLLLFRAQPSIDFFPLQMHLERSSPSVIKQLPYILDLLSRSHLCLHTGLWCS